MDSFFEIFGMYRYPRTVASNQMDVKEAEAALRSRPIDDMVTPYSSSACRVLAYEYLRLTDPTPATVEWCREVCGPFRTLNADWLSFDHFDLYSYPRADGRLELNLGMSTITNPTRGDVLSLLRVFNERKV